MSSEVIPDAAVQPDSDGLGVPLQMLAFLLIGVENM